MTGGELGFQPTEDPGLEGRSLTSAGPPLRHTFPRPSQTYDQFQPPSPHGTCLSGPPPAGVTGAGAWAGAGQSPLERGPSSPLKWRRRLAATSGKPQGLPGSDSHASIGLQARHSYSILSINNRLLSLSGSSALTGGHQLPSCHWG